MPGAGGPQLVCWMLTADDGGADGRKISYLKDPARYRAVDADLFDSLGRIVASGARTTTAVETDGTLPSATFFRTRSRMAPVNARVLLGLCGARRRGTRSCSSIPTTD